MEEKSDYSRMVTGWFVAIDRHCLVYFFLIGVVLGWLGPQHDPWAGGFAFCLLGAFIWYPCKALLICGDTASTMIARGEPLIKAGGVTEYDRNKARITGEYMAEAMKRDRELEHNKEQ